MAGSLHCATLQSKELIKLGKDGYTASVGSRAESSQDQAPSLAPEY